jgi:tetratricopeptide (TPR) repeat protein
MTAFSSPPPPPHSPAPSAGTPLGDGEPPVSDRRVARVVMILLGLLVMAFVVLWAVSERSAESAAESGRAAIDRRDFPQAVALLEQAVRRDPQLASAWKLLAEAAVETNDAERTQAALDKVFEIEPQSAGKLCFKIGSIWMNRNRIQPALRALKLATVVSVPMPDPYRLMAQMYGVTGSRQGVVSCLMELLKRRSVTRDDLVVLSSVNPTLNDPPRLAKILEADSDYKSPLLTKVMQALDRNRVDAAQAILTEILQSQPEDVEAQGILGELYADFQPEAFLEWHSRLPPEADGDARIWLARGKWLQARGETPSAIRCLYESFAREPESLTTATLLGQLLKASGESALGDAFTERSRHLQRIIDLSDRLISSQDRETMLSMIDEMEAAGRLWEAWGWCAVAAQMTSPPNAALAARSEGFEKQFTATLPRTDPKSLPGRDHDWQRYPLPDWSRLTSVGSVRREVDDDAPATIRFVDRALEAGLEFRYVNTSAQESGHKIFETMGAGVAVLDFDGDGWPDLYLAQGKPLPLDSPEGPSDSLYRNAAGSRYQDVTGFAAVREVSYSQGVAAGDFNGDGFPDLYVANLGRNRLLENCGDGTFRDVTELAGITQSAWTVCCAMADLNGDGLPELFDVNYVEGSDLLSRTCHDAQGRPVVCRPTVFEAALDTVLVNQGEGRFESLQAEAGLDLPQGRGLGVVVADVSGDGLLDLFVANDMSANYLLINATPKVGGVPVFREEAFSRGAALDRSGLAQACMGIACGDINRDGAVDLFVTNFARESNTLYLSQTEGSQSEGPPLGGAETGGRQPRGLYLDETQPAGLRGPSFDPLGFGTQFLDADRDGWLDIVVANGHIDEFVDEPFRMKAQFFRGQPEARFTELAPAQLGPLFDELRLARGLAVLDWNRDGRSDFVATDLERPVLLAENATDSGNYSLRLRLVGTNGARDAIGAKVRVTVTPGDERVCQLTAGDGYEASNERTLEIGTGSRDAVARIDIQWPSGKKSSFTEVSCQRHWTVVEGRAELTE